MAKLLISLLVVLIIWTALRFCTGPFVPGGAAGIVLGCITAVALLAGALAWRFAPDDDTD